MPSSAYGSYTLNDYSKHLVGRHFKLIKDLPQAALDNPVSIDEVLEKGQTGDIVCFRGRGPPSREIQAVSRECYSHAVVLYRGQFTRREENGKVEVYGQEGRLQILQAMAFVEGSFYNCWVNGVETVKDEGVMLSPYKETYLDELLVRWGEIGCWYRLNAVDDRTRRNMELNFADFAGTVAHCHYDGGIVYMSLKSVLAGLFNIPTDIERDEYYCSALVAACLMKAGVLPEERGGRNDGHSVLSYTPGTLGDPKVMNSRTINGFWYDPPRLMQRDCDINDPAIQAELQEMYEISGEGPNNWPYPPRHQQTKPRKQDILYAKL